MAQTGMKHKVRRFSILTYNIDTNLFKLQGTGPFGKYFPNHFTNVRVDGIIKFINKIDPDIINLQEGRIVPEFKIDTVTPFVEAFKERYDVIVNKYNDSTKAFQYISCFKRDTFNIVSNKVYYLTETPNESRTPEQLKEYEECSKDKMKDLANKWREINGGEEFEKSIAATTLKTKRGSKLVSINCHFGVSKKHRFYAPEVINKIIESNFKGMRIIMTGDFNTFQDDGGIEQAKLIKLNDLNVQKYLVDYREGKKQFAKAPYPSTFHFYPYDFGLGDKFKDIKEDLDNIFKNPEKVVEETLKLYQKCSKTISEFPASGQLDHIYVTDCISAKNTYMIPVWNEGIEAVEWNSENIAKLVEKYGNKKAILLSDHQAVFCKFTLLK